MHLYNIGNSAVTTDLSSLAQSNLPAGVPAPIALPLARVTAGVLLGLTQGFGLYLVSNNLGDIQGSLGATAVAFPGGRGTADRSGTHSRLK